MKLDFSNLRILVIGDFMIDHYIMGSSNRISPEAPVPVVIPNDEFSIPGGAGNVAWLQGAPARRLADLCASGGERRAERGRMALGAGVTDRRTGHEAGGSRRTAQSLRL